MIGVIYKLTIVAKYKMNGCKPFYIGQHWEKRSVEDFLKRKPNVYIGSGSIWYDFIRRLKKDYPKSWYVFIVREVLYASEKVNQKGLDALERHYIKKEKAHYSHCLGGCNILHGTANKFGSGSPSKDPLVAKKISQAVIKNKSHVGSNNGFYNKRHSEETKRKISEFRIQYYKTHENPLKGKHHTPEAKKRMSEAQRGEKSWMYGRKGVLCHNYGRKLSEETRRKISKSLSGVNNPNYGKTWSAEMRRKISEHHADFSGDKNPMYGKRGVDSPMYGRKWINNGKICKFADISNGIPQGYKLGRLKFNNN